MDRLLTINGKSYKAAEFDINLVCDFEDSGISLDDINKKMFSVLRQYVATSMGVDAKTAGREMGEHVKNGGTIDDAMNVMSDMMSDSAFFRTKQTNSKTGDTKRTRTKKTESEEVTS